MAELQRPKTREEARKLISDQRAALGTQLRQALSAKDEKTAMALMEKIDALDAQSRALAEASIGIPFTDIRTGNIPIGQIGSAFQSGLLGTVTWPADLTILGKNFLFGGDTPTAHEYLSQKLGIVTNPISEEGSTLFRALEGVSGGGGSKAASALMGTAGAVDANVGDTGVVQGITGLAMLGAGGFKALKDWRKTAKGKALVEGFSKDLPPEELNALRQFMLNGQGSNSPLAASALQRLKADPKYAEMFSTLEKAATEATLSKAGPVSSIQEGQTQRVVKGVTSAVQQKVESLRTAQKTAGTDQFEAAYKIAGDSKFVDTSNTLSTIRGLIDRYSQKASPDSEKVVKALQDLEAKLSPTGQTAAYPGSTQATTRTVVGRDAAGMPIESQVPTTIQIPGSPGYKFSYGDQKMSVPQLQGWLSEFGAKASNEGALFKELSLDAQSIISKSVFGALKKDLEASYKGASGDERKALGALRTARNNVADASNTYLDLVAQGLPDFFKNKALRDVDYKDLFDAYKKLSPDQRKVASAILSEADPQSLNYMNRQLFNEFVDSAKAKRADGTLGEVDLSTLASKWASMPKAEKDVITSALGVKAEDFSKRMKDAAEFTRTMDVGQPKVQEAIPASLRGDTEALAGAAGGYQTGKIARLGMDFINSGTPQPLKGLTNEDLMKVLLNPDALATLRKADLTKGTKEALSALEVPSWARAAVQQGTQGIEKANRPDYGVEVPELPPISLVDHEGTPIEAAPSTEPVDKQPITLVD